MIKLDLKSQNPKHSGQLQCVPESEWDIATSNNFWLQKYTSEINWETKFSYKIGCNFIIQLYSIYFY